MKRLLAVAALLGSLTACFGTVGVEGEYYDDGVYLPPAYIATTAPVYYEGVPYYWYSGRWYRNYGGGWRTMRSEPVYLRDYRVHAAVPVQPGYVHGAAPVAQPYQPTRQYYGRTNTPNVYRGRRR